MTSQHTSLVMTGEQDDSGNRDRGHFGGESSHDVLSFRNSGIPLGISHWWRQHALYLPLGVLPAHICRHCSSKPCHCYVNVGGTACHHHGDFMAIDLTLH